MVTVPVKMEANTMGFFTGLFLGMLLGFLGVLVCVTAVKNEEQYGPTSEEAERLRNWKPKMGKRDS